MAKIKQKSREKIAFAVFVIAIATIFAGVGVYMYFSHAFDLTASGIDDNVGQLNDYAAIVFEGNNTTRTRDAQQDQAEAEERAKKEQTGVVYVPADTANVSKLYQKKGATTAVIELDNYKAYENGEIIERGEWRFGLLSVTQSTIDSLRAAKESADNLKDKTTPVIIEEFQKKIDNLRIENRASMVVLISPDSEILKYVSKVDCLLADKFPSNVEDEGKMRSDVFVMPIPRQDEVGALVVSPAKMTSGAVYRFIDTRLLQQTKSTTGR